MAESGGPSGAESGGRGGFAVRLDASGSEPPFEQVRRQVAEAVQSGILVPGSKLPTVRALAEELGVAVNTVARSYRELEADGIIETRGRSGSFVAASGDPRMREGHAAALAFAQRARHLGFDADEALDLVRSAFRA
ncbi:GntR family transcriptional regulator [Subtercola boreus]|uniref:GntR family transcriptional regulator n=1 Tax=Subtercola boreus TaxID=120213 RepID=A0A3E0VCW1_9MICO|nr:GntR family transcriptional regulator [Subtercola boreus]RFA07744.1 GntR family transcriptional regulator [Subtercola boreus]